MGPQSPTPATLSSASIDRPNLIERVGEAAVVQVYADGFRDLPLREKRLVWHLTQAAVAGRDIFYDQRYAHNLEMRDVLEAILTHVERKDREDRKETCGGLSLRALRPLRSISVAFTPCTRARASRSRPRGHLR